MRNSIRLMLTALLISAVTFAAAGAPSSSSSAQAAAPEAPPASLTECIRRAARGERVIATGAGARLYGVPDADQPPLLDRSFGWIGSAHPL